MSGKAERTDEIQEQIQDFLLLQRVAQKMTSILDLDSLLEEVVQDVARTFGYTRSAVLLKDEDTNELVIASVRGWTKNFHTKGDRLEIGTKGICGHVAETGQMYYAPDVRKDPHYIVSEESTLSEVDIPLKVRGRLIGIFNAQHSDIDAFPPHRLQLLEALAGHLATAIQNARLFELERSENERVSRELDQARSIQVKLLPDRSPEVPHFKIGGQCTPCSAVGGDWYDYVELPDGKVGVVLGDVTGKGLGAALLMSSTRSILRLHARLGESPAAVLTAVNRILCDDFPEANFVTAIYCVLDPEDRTLTFASAGHLHPLHVVSNEARYIEHEARLPLGIADASYVDFNLEMPPDSRFFMFSDGVTEAMCPSGDDDYGAERLLEHVKHPDASAQTIIHEVSAYLGNGCSDDVTVVKIEAV